MNKLSNIFLINMPHLSQDPVFGQSLIYICEHNNEGAMGLMINKPLQKEQSSDILKEIGLNNQSVYFGGPVSPEKGFILHDCDYKKDETMLISNTAAISYSNEIINDIKNGSGPSIFRLIMGYSGWDAGQLEEELENGDWMVIPSSKDLIFSKTDKDKWDIVISDFDINIRSVASRTTIELLLYQSLPTS